MLMSDFDRRFLKPNEAIISESSSGEAEAIEEASGYFSKSRGRTFSTDFRVVQFKSMQATNIFQPSGQSDS
jgi:hypothetical protein